MDADILSSRGGEDFIIKKNNRIMNIKYRILLSLLFISTSLAQFGGGQEHISITPYASFDKVYAGGELKIAVKIIVDDSWHINSNKPYEDYLIPTEILIDTASGISIKKIYYPPAEDYQFSFSETPLSVWQGEVTFGALIVMPDNIKPGEYKIPVSVDYQACNDMSCVAPSTVSDTLIIQVADSREAVKEINQEMFKNIDLSYSALQSSADEDSSSLSSILENSGIFISLLFIFIGGLALNLTPCVYPLIPITIGYFGGQSEGSTSKLFLLGLLFVLGMAITYSVIGVVTALSGAVFGALLQSPVVIIIIAAIFVVLSLSMFGVYEFKMPDVLVAKAGGAKGGMFGAFFMGLTMGIVAAPCIGPFVLGLVTYVAAKADPYSGFLMFFVLALGLGTPYLFLAIFSGKIKKLPRAGMWMEGVKHVFGFILVGMALYFLLPLIPKEISAYVLPVYMLIVGAYLLLFENVAGKVTGFRIFKIVFSLLLIAAAVYSAVPSSGESIPWKPYSENINIVNADDKKGTIIDFYADWCIPCKELDAMTFSDPAVIAESERFNTFKADMTKSLSAEVELLRNRYKIVGVPTVLVLNASGEEVERITGFVGPEEFLKVLQKVN